MKKDNEGITLEMPNYKSHKIVHALKISEITKKDKKTIIFPENQNYASFQISKEYVEKHDPKPGGYYVIYADGYESWSPAKAFEEGYTLVEKVDGTKTLGNTDINQASKNVKDLEIFGNGDMFKLLSKASSKAEGWMKSTKAMEIEGKGCVVQVTTQQGDHVAEALVFVPNVKIVENRAADNTIVGRILA